MERLPPRTLIMVCGPSFSGKSTAARALEAGLGATRISLDDIVRSLGFEPGDGAPDHVWIEAHQKAKRRAGEAMACGSPFVVIDDTNCFRFLRDAFRAVADSNGYATMIVTLTVPMEELQRRRVANDLSKGREPIRDDVFAKHVAGFEWPAHDEGAVEWSEDFLGTR